MPLDIGTKLYHNAIFAEMGKVSKRRKRKADEDESDFEEVKVKIFIFILVTNNYQYHASTIQLYSEL